jgi:hypothetical protein
MKTSVAYGVQPVREIDLRNEEAGTVAVPQQKKVWVDPVCEPVEIVLKTRNSAPPPIIDVDIGYGS